MKKLLLIGLSFILLIVGCGLDPNYVSPLSLNQEAALFCFILWLIILIFTGYVGFSTILAGIILPIITAFYFEEGLGSPLGIFTIIISLFIIFTHRSNIQRMLNGNENRFEKAMIFRKNAQ